MAHLPRFLEHRRPVDVRVPVNESEAHELGLLEARHQAEDAGLLAPLQLRLTPDEAEMVRGEVVLAQLQHRVRPAAGARVHQAHRLHRTEAQRVLPAFRHHLDRQAPLEELLLLEVVDRRALGMDERLVEDAVLGLVEGAVQVVARIGRRVVFRLGDLTIFRLRKLPIFRWSGVQAPSPTRGPKHPRSVDRLREDDGADGIVEVQVGLADERRHLLGERRGRERPGGDDDWRGRGDIRGDGAHFLADQRDQRVLAHRARDPFRKTLAIDRERSARRHPHLVGHPHHQRAEPTHFFFQEPDGVVEFVAAERVAADEFREVGRAVHLGGAHRPHLVDGHRNASRGRLPRGLAARQAAADYMDHRWSDLEFADLLIC
jgi:hypothetical protein